SQPVNPRPSPHYLPQQKSPPIQPSNTIPFPKHSQPPPPLQNPTTSFYFPTHQSNYQQSNLHKLKSPLPQNINHQHP
ncbi:hypothetical protein, partial [Staphylococcus epidermidis]|uniref:hypothetical protein n=1 Tax=Staphylococcus epidermidis TaxID=1282 RepID=UPI001C92F19A